MKKRLCGLLALLLCAVTVCAPVAAMAYTWIEPGNVSPYQQVLIYANTDMDIISAVDSGREIQCIIYDDEGKTETVDFASVEGRYRHNLKKLGNQEAWLVTSFDESGTHEMSVSKVREIYREKLQNPVGDIDIYLIGLDNLDAVYASCQGSEYGEYEETHGEDLQTIKAALKGAVGNQMSDYAGIKYYEFCYAVFHPEVKQIVQILPYPMLEPGTLDETIVLPYPEGYSYANAKAEDFCLAHLKVVGANDEGNAITEMETLPVTPTPDGLEAKVDSVSPFALGYKEPPAVPAAPAAPSVPQTGDNANLALYALLCVLGMTGATLLIKRKKA